MIKVAVIGPAEIVHRVQEEGEKLSNIVFILQPYSKEQEALEIAIQISHHVDVILFTGPVPYRIAYEQKDKIKALLICVNYGGTGFFRVLFQMIKDGYLNITGKNRISIDFLNKEEVISAFDELDIDHSQMQILEFNEPISSEKIVEHHVSLWKSGKVTCSITCLYSVYKKLIELSIPVFCIIPTRQAIQEALNLAFAKAKEKTFENNQIAICKVSFEMGISSDIKKNILSFISEVLQTNGQMVTDDAYLFYTTRGFVFSFSNGFSQMPLLIQQFSSQIFMGVGIGNTVIEATERARIAHLKSCEAEGNQLYIVKNDNAVIRVFKGESNPPLQFESRSYDEIIRQIADKTNLAFSTLSKIQYVLKTLKKRDLSAVELARQLNITIRSARRILQSLATEGYAEVIGGEQPLHRGRPRQIYKILI